MTAADSGAGRARARLHAWSYWPALSHPAMRRLLPGYALSALGDGMSAVAVAWLALRLAPAASRGLWTGAALAAYTLPGTIGMLAFGRWLRERSGVRLAGTDAALRAAALGTVPVLAAAHLLTPLGYVCLLGVSSLLHAWGAAGQYTLISEILPAGDRVAGNGLLGMAGGIAMIGGPALAGLLTAVAGPVVVIAADAATFAVLALSYAWAAPLISPARAARDPAEAPPALPPDLASAGAGLTGNAGLAAGADPEGVAQAASGVQGASAGQGAGTGWRVILASPTLSGLLVLTFVFYLLYGPVEVALPVHVAADLHGSAALLGALWTAFAVGAVLGTLAAPRLRRFPVWPAMTVIVAGWGLALLPLGLGAPVWLSMAAFAAGGVIYGPYTSLSIAVFQDSSPPGQVAPVLAARSALIIAAAPVGTALGGPLVAVLGAGGTLLWSALTTIALAAAAPLAVRAARTWATARRGAAADQPAGPDAAG